MTNFVKGDFVRFIRYNEGHITVDASSYGVVQDVDTELERCAVKWYFKDSTPCELNYPIQYLIHYEDIMMFIAWKVREGYLKEEDVLFLTLGD